MQRFRNASLTSFLSIVATAVRFTVSIVSVPLVISYLGASQYGLIVTIGGMAAWLSFIDGGIGLSLKNALIHECSQKGRENVLSELFSTAFIFVLLFSIFAGVVLTITLHFLPLEKILNLDSLSNNQMVIYFLYATIWLMLLNIPLGLLRVAYAAIQKEFLFIPWTIVASLLGLGLTVYSIRSNFGLLWVGISSIFAANVALIAGMLWTQISGGKFRISICMVNLAHLKSLLKPGAGFLIIQIATIFIFQSDIFIVNYFLGHEYAAEYSIHLQLLLYAQTAVGMITGPYWSALGDAGHKNEITWFKQTLFKLTLLSASMMIIFGCIINLLGKNIVAYWSHGKIIWNAPLGLVITVFITVTTTAAVYGMALGALNVVRGPAKLALIQAFVNIILCVIFVQRLGILGIALGTLLSYLLTAAWYIPYRLYKVLKTRSAFSLQAEPLQT